MAFWGAPTPNPRHALSCVRAALSAQRAVHDLNLQREKENVQRREENLSRTAKGLDPQPLLPTLSLGTGINTGLAVAGLMGSAESESLSYTVFGREVNLASRLEGASGRGRIFISASTLSHLQKDDPALAATCIPLEPMKVKGFRNTVQVYEVPWIQGETAPTIVPPFPPRHQTPIC
jgi:adenylate cyclase